MIGVVLMGGKSTRMQTDKSQLILNGIPLYLIAASKINPFCTSVHFSISQIQSEKIAFGITVFVDREYAEGPLNVIYDILSKVNTKILFIACDMINADHSHIKDLVEKDKEEKYCTCYFDETNNRYEPLLSIWSPACLPLLNTFLSTGEKSIQKFLIKNNIEKILNINASLVNVNTEKDWEKYQHQFSNA